jgi:hypothetical protein
VSVGQPVRRATAPRPPFGSRGRPCNSTSVAGGWWEWRSTSVRSWQGAIGTHDASPASAKTPCSGLIWMSAHVVTPRARAGRALVRWQQGSRMNKMHPDQTMKEGIPMSIARLAPAVVVTICLAVLAGLVAGCGGRGEDLGAMPFALSENSAAGEAAVAALWERVGSVGRGGRGLASLDGTVFAISRTRLLRSDNLGTTWTRIDTSAWADGSFNDLDTDDGRLYVASGYGLFVSPDEGRSFELELKPWCGVQSVDYRRGVGWCTSWSWAHDSGAYKIEPGGEWKHLVGGSHYWLSFESIVADPLDPDNVAYAHCVTGGTPDPHGLMTRNGGLTWELCWQGRHTHSAFKRAGVAWVASGAWFTRSQGQRWIPLGLDTRSVVKDGPRRRLFAAATPGGVFVGGPQSWRRYGLLRRAVVSLAICSDYLFALTDTGAILRTPLAVGSPTATYTANDGASTALWEED